MNLSDFETCDLVEELKKREGVEHRNAEPDSVIDTHVTGPATVLIITD